MHLKIFWLAMLNIASIILLATLWEFGLEAWFSTLLGLAYDASFESSERLRFILTSSAFGGLAMVIPGLLVTGLVRKLLTAEKNALRLAGTDELTGVGNRRTFNTRILQLEASGMPYSLLLIDINDFKSINDLNGHPQGDATLVALSDLLKEFASRNTQVFRIGGDEFAVTDAGGQIEEAFRIAESLRRRATDIRTGPDTFMSISVGVACSTCCGRGDIVRAADLAMYEAKRDKKLQLRQFSPDMEQRFIQKEQLEHDVNEAVKKQTIVPFLQPLVCLRTGSVIGFEILARWITVSGSIISPEIFLPVIEKLGLMDTMTTKLLESVIPHTAGWPHGLRLAVNITPEQLLKPTLTASLSDIMHQAGRLVLELEVTEQNVMTISDDARQAIRNLKESGVSVALDDFGTGYSNLSVLLGLGLTRIKIDRSFISTIITNRQNQKVVETLLALCQELEVAVTAEGIEDAGTLAWLQEHGCEYGQGYLFSRPVPAEQASRLLVSDTAPDFYASGIRPVGQGGSPSRDSQ